MASAETSPFQRRLFIGLVVFGLFVLFDIALFGWLILDSLSKREMDRILLDTREEASELADQLAQAAEGQDRDLFTTMVVSQETRSYIEDVLLQRDLVETVEVTDSDGIVVYRKDSRTTIPALPEPERLAELVAGEDGPEIEHQVSEQQASWQVEEAIGDFALLRIAVDRQELERRVAELRQELIRRMAVIGAVTVLLLLTAYLAIGLLLRRARRLEDQAAESKRMAYIGTLAAGLAHEIRNPLNSLSLNMQMLEEEVADRRDQGSSSQRLLTITRSEIDRLERLATDFLSYARHRPLEREAVPAVELLEKACQGMAGELRSRRVDAVVEDGAGGARVAVDSGQMQQLLINLVSNALAATEDTGRPPRIVLRAKRQGSKVILEVEDNGAGMDAEEREKMFELFFSTRKGGTGLGLAIVDRIAKAHQAEVQVESEPGEGTTVRLVLPEAA
ncbi:MAG: ATP-binding protein [Acidobacteriota bacterium]|nr:ATP-binding protein [Acidobacteriota bacterium]